MSFLEQYLSPRRTLLASLALLCSCATVPIQEHDRYDGLLDYLQHGRKKDSLDRYDFFLETEDELSVKAGEGIIRYVADALGDGYCLIVATPQRPSTDDSPAGRWEEQIYCSLYGKMMDAYGEAEVEFSLVEGKRDFALRRQIIGYRRETPAFNGRSWEDLDREFRRVKRTFLERISQRQKYETISRKLQEP